MEFKLYAFLNSGCIPRVNTMKVLICLLSDVCLSVSFLNSEGRMGILFDTDLSK